MVVFGAGSLREWKLGTTFFIFAEDPEAGGRLHRPRRRALRRRRALHATVVSLRRLAQRPPFFVADQPAVSTPPSSSFPPCTHQRTHRRTHSRTSSSSGCRPRRVRPRRSKVQKLNLVQFQLFRAESTSKPQLPSDPSQTAAQPNGLVPSAGAGGRGFESPGRGIKPPFLPLHAGTRAPPVIDSGGHASTHSATPAPRWLAPHVISTGWLRSGDKLPDLNLFLHKITIKSLG